MADAVNKKYRVKHGKNFYQDGQFVPGGTVVELNPDQARAFADMVVEEGHPLPPPIDDSEGENDDDEDEGDDHADGEDHDDQDDEDDTDEGDGTDNGAEPGSGEESPIVKRRREKAERKAAKKAERDAKNKK